MECGQLGGKGQVWDLVSGLVRLGGCCSCVEAPCVDGPEPRLASGIWGRFGDVCVDRASSMAWVAGGLGRVGSVLWEGDLLVHLGKRCDFWLQK